MNQLGDIKVRPFWSKKGMQHQIFRNFVKNIKQSTSLCKLEEEDGSEVMGFKNIYKVGMNHFNNLFKKDEVTNVNAQMVRIYAFFPSFVNEEQNSKLMDEVTLEEIKEEIPYL